MLNKKKSATGGKNIIITVLLLILNVVLFGQNINGKLGTNGQFIIRDTTNTFLTLSQSTGDLTLNRNLTMVNTTSATLGVLFKGTNRFLHNYGTSNTFVGMVSGNFTMTGIENSGYGQTSLQSNTTGSENSAFGTFSLNGNTTGYQNSAFGRRSMNNNSTGIQNSAYGWDALYSNTSGFQNTAIGNSSLLYNTGNYNTAVGYNSGSTITTGANLTCIGIDAAPTTPTVNDQITLGNGFVSSLRCNVQTITSLSDMRDKKNITELSLGLDFLTKLKPRQFNWDKREWYEDNKSNGSKMQETKTAGFIAQELDEVQTTENADWLNLVLKDNPEKWEATYGNLLPVMVKAIQELKSENDELKDKLSKFEQMQNTMANEIEKLKSNDKMVKYDEKVKLSENLK